MATNSGKVFKIRALLKNAKLIEVNDSITPELLRTKPEGEGFLAIFMFREQQEQTGEQLLKNLWQPPKSLI